MKPAVLSPVLASFSCAVLLLAAGGSWAAGPGGGQSGGGHRSGGAHHHGGHSHARVFISAPLFFYPGPYSYYPAPAYSTPVPPPIYIEQPGPAAEYWFCPGAGGYYPQVTDCPGGWRRVLPAGTGPSFPG